MKDLLEIIKFLKIIGIVVLFLYKEIEGIDFKLFVLVMIIGEDISFLLIWLRGILRR